MPIARLRPSWVARAITTMDKEEEEEEEDNNNDEEEEKEEVEGKDANCKIATEPGCSSNYIRVPCLRPEYRTAA